MATAESTHWLADSAQKGAAIDALCFGTGRFLRSVLVPALVAAGFHPALIQTRGRTFFEFMNSQETNAYPIDTLLADGTVETAHVPCFGAFSIGTKECKQALYECLPRMQTISILGIGVTEAGLSSPETQAMKDLFELLEKLNDMCKIARKLCLLDMDNVPNNANVLQSHLTTLAKDKPHMLELLKTRLSFHNTMVDRITSQRQGSNGLVPQAEPVPAKALVLLDMDNHLPMSLTKLSVKLYGVVIRRTPDELETDVALKLRVANGTHTAVAHVLALLGRTMTSFLATSQVDDNKNDTAKLLVKYLDALFCHQILEAGVSDRLQPNSKECQNVWNDWRNRLMHAQLSSFFITQNAAAKGGIRLGPTIIDLVRRKKAVTVTMAFAFAVLLRWLTPSKPYEENVDEVFTGWLSSTTIPEPIDEGTVVYADNMRYNLQEGWYEFKCVCKVGPESRTLSEWLGSLERHEPPVVYAQVIRAYLVAPDGGNMNVISDQLDPFVAAVATLYKRMVAGDDLVELLKEMDDGIGPFVNGWATDCRVLSIN
jgi:mannitol-1-phosphate/altronate dehydrogenase